MLRRILLLCCLIAVVVPFAILTSSEQPLHPQIYNQISRPDEPQGAARKRLFSWLDFMSDYCTSHRSSEQSEWRKKFICESKVTDAVVAFFTTILTIFTGLLVLVGGRQARLTRETLVNTQRAFVFATGFTWLWDEPDSKTGEYSWRFRPNWRNSGATPTKNFISHTHCELRDSVLPSGFNFDYSTDQKGGGLIGPNFDVSGGLAPGYPSPAITCQDILDVQAGKKHLYLWGWARYYDVFPNTPQHVTKFCWWLTPMNDPKTFVPGQNPTTTANAFYFNFIHHPEGNETRDEPRNKKLP